MDVEMILPKTCRDDKDHAFLNGNARHLHRLMRKHKQRQYQRQRMRRHFHTLEQCIGLHNASWETALGTTITQIYHLLESQKSSFTSVKLNPADGHLGDDKIGQ